ncbi:MAG: acylphosphatase [Ornithinimicrobium sp.]
MAGDAGETVRALIFVRGSVQNVGFRWWTRSRALELEVVGHARNMRDGRVEVNAQGTREAVDSLCAMLRSEQAPSGRPGRVEAASVQWHDPQDDLTGFLER